MFDPDMTNRERAEELVYGDSNRTREDVVIALCAILDEVQAFEREACAKVADVVCDELGDSGDHNEYEMSGHAADIANSIRARSK